jgi:hypothetical protein
LPGACRESQLNSLGAGRTHRRQRLQGNVEAGAGHTQLADLPGERFGKNGRGFGATRAHPRRLGGDTFPKGRNLSLQLGDTLVRAGHLGDARRCLSEEDKHVAVGLAVLALKAAQGADPFSHFLQPVGIRQQRLAVTTNVPRQLDQVG